MAVEIDPMTWKPDYSFTGEPMPYVLPWDRVAPIDIFKYRLAKCLRIEQARRNPMLIARNSAGALLYKMTEGGNLSRIFPLSQRVIRLVKDRDGHACVLCLGVKSLEIDHIIRYVDGGSNDPENLRTLCRRCHSKRGGRA